MLLPLNIVCSHLKNVLRTLARYAPRALQLTDSKVNKKKGRFSSGRDVDEAHLQRVIQGDLFRMIVAGVQVFLASHSPQTSGLLQWLVWDAGNGPLNGSLHAFRAKRADRVKIAWWDGSGVCRYSKRFEKEQLCWPRIVHKRVPTMPGSLGSSMSMDWKRSAGGPSRF